MYRIIKCITNNQAYWYIDTALIRAHEGRLFDLDFDGFISLEALRGHAGHVESITSGRRQKQYRRGDGYIGGHVTAANNPTE